MNVCMISYSIYDSDARVMRYAETLVRRGDHVDVIALSDGRAHSQGIVNGVNVFRVQSRTRKEKSKFSYLFRILLFFVRASWFVSRRELKMKYQLVHIHSVPDFLVFSAWLPKLRGAKIILDIHDILPEFYATKFRCSEGSFTYTMLLAIERWSAAFADHVIVANDIWRDRFVSRSTPGHKCSAILNFPDRKVFSQRGRTRDLQKTVMIYPGSLNWHQGLDIAIRSFAQIKDAIPNCEFQIYGTGPAQVELQALAAELGVADRVKFNGQREVREIVELMENADFGVVPKRNDPFGDEAFSTKILEFMAMGIPVIVSGTKIDRYYFDDSVVKFFSPGCEDELANAMAALCNSTEERQAIARRASKFVENYDWDTNKHKYLDVVDSLCAGQEQFHTKGALEFQRNEEKVAKQSSQSIVDYYRCPDELIQNNVNGKLSEVDSYFRFGDDTVCYGQYSGRGSRTVSGDLPDAMQQCAPSEGRLGLPFDIDQVVRSLRCETYASGKEIGNLTLNSAVANAYYSLRPLLPVKIRKRFQKLWLNDWDKIPFPSWPVDFSVDNLLRNILALTLKVQGMETIPFIWFWPDGASSCAIMTHDVESTKGRDHCSVLMDLDDSYGIKSSFQVVPEYRYKVTPDYLGSIRRRGFEVNVQDLNHDGNLYKDKAEFTRRAQKINKYGREWGVRGFRAGVLYRNQMWFDQLDFDYDMSVPNVAHLDPQRGGCCTVMPYFIGSILELPVTTTQDYSLFHILNDYSIDLWKRQAELILGKHGLMSFIVHPDYIIADRARRVYEDLLGYLAGLRDERGVWVPTPGEVNRWWRQRAKMTLVQENGEWRVEGEGHERARIAYASEKNGRLEVMVDPSVAKHEGINRAANSYVV